MALRWSAISRIWSEDLIFCKSTCDVGWGVVCVCLKQTHAQMRPTKDKTKTKQKHAPKNPQKMPTNLQVTPKYINILACQLNFSNIWSIINMHYFHIAHIHWLQKLPAKPHLLFLDHWSPGTRTKSK